MTIELMWQDVLPQFAVPPERFRRGWLNHASVDTILAAIEYVRGRHFNNADHAGRVVSSLLKNVTYAE